KKTRDHGRTSAQRRNMMAQIWAAPGFPTPGLQRLRLRCSMACSLRYAYAEATIVPPCGSSAAWVERRTSDISLPRTSISAEAMHIVALRRVASFSTRGNVQLLNASAMLFIGNDHRPEKKLLITEN